MDQDIRFLEDGCEICSNVENLLGVIKTDKVDELDKVLLEMLIEDIKTFIQAGVSMNEHEAVWVTLNDWAIPEFIQYSLSLLPNQVQSTRKEPVYHHKFALNLLSSIIPHESLFVHLQGTHKGVLESLVVSCEALDADAALCLPLAAAVAESLQHAPGRLWAQNTGVWAELITTFAEAGGGRFRPALERLLIGRLAALWAGPTLELAPPLEAVRRFLVVAPRRLAQEPADRQSWMVCCDMLRRLAVQLLGESAARAAGQQRELVRSLAGQVSLLMELACAAFVPAQLFMNLHLLDQSGSDESVTSAARRACRALSKHANPEALRDVTTLLLDACLLDRRASCLLSAAAAAPLWSVLRRCEAEMSPEETACAAKHWGIFQEFVAGDSLLETLLDVKSDGPRSDRAPFGPEQVIAVMKSVFLSRADRPRRSSAAGPEAEAVCGLLRPWVALVRLGHVREARAEVEILTFIANISGCSSATSQTGSVTPLLGLVDVIVRMLEGEKPGRTQVCALQCLAHCAPLLPWSADDCWDRLAARLKGCLNQPTGEDVLDAAGETVLALVRSANQRPAAAESTNRMEAPTLAGWLAANRLPSTALSALLEAGPGERRTADWLLEAVLETAGGGASALWEEVNKHVDVMQAMECCLDLDLVVDTAALRLLEARHRFPCSWSGEPSAEQRAAVSAFLQAALCSGDREISSAAQRAFAAAAQTDLSRAAVSAETAARWLADGTALALLRLAQSDPAHRAALRPISAALVAADVIGDDVIGGADESATISVDAAGSRDEGRASDGVSRDAVISCVLSESTCDFFSAREGGARGRHVERLRPRPEVRLTRQQFLDAVMEQEKEVAAEVAPSESGGDALEVLAGNVTARVHEIARCAIMDTQTDIPIDCY